MVSMSVIHQKQRGFTIVELLIVIVVIAILAAISIAAYRGIQNRANDTAVMNDLSMLSKKIKAFRVVNERYPRGSTDLETMGLRISKNSYSRGMFNGTNWYNLVYCWPNAANPEVFGIVAESKSGAVLESRNGVVSKVAYGVEGSGATCTAVGVTMDGGSDRDWFYNNDAWFSYAG